MKYGYFEDTAREYVITNPKTPVKWINYIGTLEFGGFVDHTGGALICRRDPALNRITRYLFLLPNSEFKGETLYIRFREGNGYRIFSPFFVPTLDPYEFYECHVGLGYTRIVSKFYGIVTDVTIFVPVGETCEIRDIKVTNTTDRPLEIDIIPVVEYSHPDALKQLTNNDWVPQTMQSKAHWEEGGYLVLSQFPFMFKETQINYFTSNHPVSSFESDRRRFLGDNEYGTWARPLSLLQDELSNYEALRGDNIGALLHHMGIVNPGETVRLVTQLGQAESVEKALPSIRRFRKPEEVERALDELKLWWEEYLLRLQVETPDRATNILLNIYNPRQCYVTFNWSRELSLYQPGYGTRGIGFRDSSQDVLAIMSRIPDDARALIRKLLMVQKKNGSAMHQFYPLTMEANEGDARFAPDRPKYYSDDHLWAVLAVTAYLKETGNIAFLDEEIPYYEKGPDGKPLESGTVLDHLRRAIEFTWNDRGAHGLPLLGFADWNDTVNLLPGAESVFTACLFGKALLEMMELCHYLGDEGSLERYRRYYEEIKELVNRYAWDGEWYISYFDCDGSPLGSKINTEGKIFVYVQAWLVMAGFAPPERARKALDAVYRYLNTSKGIKLSLPGYKRYDPAKGGVTTYPPGAKENGGIFLHPNSWVIIAETLMGNGDRAYEYYVQINPILKNDMIDEYECEPYVFAQNLLGDEHPQFGLARNSWLTGTASWAYIAATQYILGIQPHYKGLIIDPCIPSRWQEFRVKRQFRGATYDIVVKNPKNICKGVALVKLNGRELEGNLLPVQEPGSEHKVEVIMGNPKD
ncbi:MAG: glycosyl transferase [Anaerolineae bacterium]|nr:glycosyl transferase [Anaerolineae bacterium]MDW8102041.1 glycosyl transferase [Anaerolineae bacterium]